MPPTSTNSNTTQQLAEMRRELAELRAVLVPLAAPSLRELGALHNSLCRSIRSNLPGEHDAEVAAALADLPERVAEEVMEQVKDAALRVLVPLLPVLIQAWPKLADLATVLQANLSTDG